MLVDLVHHQGTMGRVEGCGYGEQNRAWPTEMWRYAAAEGTVCALFLLQRLWRANAERKLHVVRLTCLYPGAPTSGWRS
jgi:hypothetical protein